MTCHNRPCDCRQNVNKKNDDWVKRDTKIEAKENVMIAMSVFSEQTNAAKPHLTSRKTKQLKRHKAEVGHVEQAHLTRHLLHSVSIN